MSRLHPARIGANPKDCRQIALRATISPVFMPLLSVFRVLHNQTVYEGSSPARLTKTARQPRQYLSRVNLPSPSGTRSPST
jgi:hypothetical protein